jgi:hypothetical protein
VSSAPPVRTACRTPTGGPLTGAGGAGRRRWRAWVVEAGAGEVVVVPGTETELVRGAEPPEPAEPPPQAVTASETATASDAAAALPLRRLTARR